jgi:hypothetical protein
MKYPEFPQRYTYYLWLPVIILTLALLTKNRAGTSFEIPGSIILTTLSLVSLILLIVVYWAQIKYCHYFLPSKKFRTQFLLFGAAVVLPVIAIFIGDYGGSAHFADEPNGAGQDLLFGLLVGGVLLVSFFYAALLGNSIYIKTKGMSNGYQTLSRIIYGIAWFIIAGISYYAYALVYSLHDPSTE